MAGDTAQRIYTYTYAAEERAGADNDQYYDNSSVGNKRLSFARSRRGGCRAAEGEKTERGAGLAAMFAEAWFAAPSCPGDRPDISTWAEAKPQGKRERGLLGSYSGRENVITALWRLR